jgi:hypothetical protein
MEYQYSEGALVCAQVAPEFVEAYITGGFADAAANFVPSDEQVMEIQVSEGVLVCVQVAPELAEM